MNRKQKLGRIAALFVVASALALPCAGWGWEGADSGNDGGDAPAATAQP
jgi:hypothetical protein